ncbi:hypothetical protein M3Y96_01010600 [Aphelenchoides besseyi]|nr:hypothetical protein M3Y96_01010600 [Aphelenchoides besseyi]
MSKQTIAVVLSFLLFSSTFALPTNELIKSVVKNGNGVLNVVNPAIDDLGLLTGSCKVRGTFSKVTSLLNLPAAIDPITAIELVLLVVKLERALNKLTCTLDTALPLDIADGLIDKVDDLLTEVGGSAIETVDELASGIEDDLSNLLVQLGDLLKSADGIANLVAYAQSLIVQIESLLSQLLSKVNL